MSNILTDACLFTHTFHLLDILLHCLGFWDFTWQCLSSRQTPCLGKKVDVGCVLKFCMKIHTSRGSSQTTRRHSFGSSSMFLLQGVWVSAIYHNTDGIGASGVSRSHAPPQSFSPAKFSCPHPPSSDSHRIWGRVSQSQRWCNPRWQHRATRRTQRPMSVHTWDTWWLSACTSGRENILSVSKHKVHWPHDLCSNLWPFKYWPRGHTALVVSHLATKLTSHQSLSMFIVFMPSFQQIHNQLTLCVSYYDAATYLFSCDWSNASASWKVFWIWKGGNENTTMHQIPQILQSRGLEDTIKINLPGSPQCVSRDGSWWMRGNSLCTAIKYLVCRKSIQIQLQFAPTSVHVINYTPKHSTNQWYFFQGANEFPFFIFSENYLRNYSGSSYSSLQELTLHEREEQEELLALLSDSSSEMDQGKWDNDDRRRRRDQDDDRRRRDRWSCSPARSLRRYRRSSLSPYYQYRRHSRDRDDSTIRESQRERSRDRYDSARREQECSRDRHDSTRREWEHSRDKHDSARRERERSRDRHDSARRERSRDRHDSARREREQCSRDRHNSARREQERSRDRHDSTRRECKVEPREDDERGERKIKQEPLSPEPEAKTKPLTKKQKKQAQQDNKGEKLYHYDYDYLTNEELNTVTNYVIQKGKRGETLPIRRNTTPPRRTKILTGKVGEEKLNDDEIHLMLWKGLKALFDTRKQKLNN